jgi:hypothetical protein
MKRDAPNFASITPRRTWAQLAFVLGAFAIGWGVGRAVEAQTQVKAGWLTESQGDKFEAIERHLRGLDMTMVEIGYRFTELNFAGLDRNWGYAQYQLDKIDLALRNGLERRPARAPSSQEFLNEALPRIRAIVDRQDRDGFEAGMERLRVSCMECHVLENTPHFTVQIPERRLAPIGNILDPRP